ncbi:PQQ-binding-like beta-propeller repeat protein, partial [Candidatus Bathyarchaeota archaeon]|nr:PQQ-binding-like beta-propeller repeat protein [Candidatus Bathyarchaeota archaeon]
MQKSINKTKITAIIIMVLLTTSTFLFMTNIPVQAQHALEQPVNGPIPSGVTPSEIIDVVAYLSFRPNPVGVNQIILINFWVTPPLNVERKHQGYTVTIKDPSGAEDVVGPMESYEADATMWFEYWLDQIGTWTLKFDFPGEYFPSGTYLNGVRVADGTPGGFLLESAYYKPASTGEQQLVVTQEPVLSWPFGEPPTDYWTRPVHLENRGWWSILGNFPAWGVVGDGQYWPDDTSKYIANYDFIPYVEAPETSHIVWKQQRGIAGIIGGSLGQMGNLANPGSPSVIYAGRCYQTYSKPSVGSVAASYDLRTGEIYYEIPTAEGGVTPNLISYSRATGEAVTGATQDDTYSVTLMSIAGNRLRKIDAYTGAVTLDVPAMNPTTIGGGFDSNLGAFHNDPYVLSSQNKGSLFNANYYLINWTTAGNTANFTERIVSNVSVGWSTPIWPGGVLGFTGNCYDFAANVNVWMVGIATPATGHYYATWMKGFDLSTGEMLWNKTFPETRYSTSSLIADHGKVALVVENGWLMCFNARTGEFLWKSDRMEYPWAQPSFGAYAIQSAYGMI